MDRRRGGGCNDSAWACARTLRCREERLSARRASGGAAVAVIAAGLAVVVTSVAVEASAVSVGCGAEADERHDEGAWGDDSTVHRWISCLLGSISRSVVRGSDGGSCYLPRVGVCRRLTEFLACAFSCAGWKAARILPAACPTVARVCRIGLEWVSRIGYNLSCSERAARREIAGDSQR